MEFSIGRDHRLIPTPTKMLDIVFLSEVNSEIPGKQERLWQKKNHFCFYNSSDIDECEGKNICAPVGGKCVNEQGKYRCECMKGYEGNGNTCKGK